MIVKICGLTCTEDALAARDAGADLLGFVFANSPRRVSPEQARKIVAALAAAPPSPRGTRHLTVGVFVDEHPDTVNRIVESVGLDLVQLHGDESPDYCRSMPVPVIKAFRVQAEGSLEALKSYLGAARYLLLDRYRPGAAGGTGETFDWSLAEGMAEFGIPWFLAGGLHPANVAGAIAHCRPDGVDVSSGVESSPGVKDHRLIREFIFKAKGAHGD